MPAISSSASSMPMIPTRKSLRKLLGSRTNPSEIVLGKFDLCDDGKLRNSRLEKEREKQLSFRKTRSENAMKRWHVDCIGNARASKVHEHSESKCNALHTSSSISTSKDVDGANTDASPAAPKKRNVTDEEFLSELRPLYPHLDIEAEMRRATAWLLTPKARGRKLTRQFLVNWLNRADAPIMKDESQAPSASRFADMLTPKE